MRCFVTAAAARKELKLYQEHFVYCSVGHGQKKHCNHCSSTHRLLGQLIITSTSAVYYSQNTSAYIFLLLQKHTAPAVPNCDQPSGCWQHPSTYHRTGCDLPLIRQSKSMASLRIWRHVLPCACASNQVRHIHWLQQHIYISSWSTMIRQKCPLLS